jgi:protein-L-isoaspartate O-methyltransferase
MNILFYLILLNSDGGLGYPELQPYDRIAITAACTEIPPPLIEQLKADGKIIAPVIEASRQNLVLLEKKETGIERRVICEVLLSCFRRNRTNPCLV